MAQKEKFVWRLRVPQNRTIVFQDLIRGEIKINTDTIGDFAIARNDESVLYLLANVIDDLTGGITHIIRGEDGISNTPRQILLWEALPHKIPQYAHIPLVLDNKKRKLSKRNVETDICVLIRDFQEKGFLPEGVLNGLALLGWNPKNTDEIFSLDQLGQIFDLKHVNQAAAQYDYEKMEWLNHQWMKKLDLETLADRFFQWMEEHTQHNLDTFRVPQCLSLIHI